MKDISPNKFKIRTLFEILESFINSLGSPVKLDNKKLPVQFDYETKRWTGTFEKGVRRYNKKDILFVNIKLPNDGFIYSKDYQGADDEIKIDDDVNKFINTIFNLAKICHEAPFEPELRTVYDTNKGRLSFYLEDKNNNKTFTLKYEYGWYELKNKDKPLLTYKQLEDLRDGWQIQGFNY